MTTAVQPRSQTAGQGARIARVANWLLVLPLTYGLLVLACAVGGAVSNRMSPARSASLALVGVAVAALSVAARRLNPEPRAKIGLLVASTGVSLLVVEAALAHFGQPKDLASIWEEECRKRGQPFDRRSKLEVVSDYRAQGIPAVNAFVPAGWYRTGTALRLEGDDVIPFGGIANRLTVFCNETGSYVTYESDEHGFHNPRGLYQPGMVDIAAVGDSFTHGMCVSSDKGFVALVRAKHPRTLNLGGAGNGPLSELGALVEYAVPLRAKTVLWCFTEANDLLDLPQEKHSVLMRYLNDPNYSARLLERQDSLDRSLEEFVIQQLAGARGASRDQGPSWSQTAESYLLLRQVRRKGSEVLRTRGFLSGFPGEDHLPLFNDVLQSAKTRMEAVGGRLYFVYLPSYLRYAGSGFRDAEYNSVKAMVEHLGVPFIDVRQSFDRHGDPLNLFPFRREGHYNEEGYRIVADTILAALN